MNKGGKSLVEPIPTRHGPLERIEPCEKAFNFPTAAIPSQRATILRCFAFSVAPMRRNHLNPLSSKGVIERITVIGTIPNNSPGRPTVTISLRAAWTFGFFLHRPLSRITPSFPPYGAQNKHHEAAAVEKSMRYEGTSMSI